MLDEQLARIGAEGHVIGRQEAVVGVVGLAVPVRGPDGELIAAIHISAPCWQMTASREAELLGAARSTAVAVEQQLALSAAR